MWQRNLIADYKAKLEGYFPVATSPLLWEDRLILAVGAADKGAGIVAVAKDDGRTLWTATDQAASHATPIAATLHGRPYVFTLTREGLVALDPRNGVEDWRVRFRANNPEFVNATTPIVHGDLIFTSAFSAGNLCVRVLPGGYEEMWRDLRRNLDSQYNPLIAIDGFVYGFAALDDSFRCLEMQTGKLLWSGLRDLDRGAAIATKHAFLILGTQGHLAMAKIDPMRLEILGQTKQPLLDGPTYAFPALHRGRLLVRNNRELISVGFEPASN